MSTARPDGVEGLSLDREALLARVESDYELLSTLVGIFKADRRNLMTAISSAFEAEDPGELAATAHTMKGALGVFGVEPARTLAEQLEDLGREGRVDGAAALYVRLEEAVISAEEALDDFLRELQ